MQNFDTPQDYNPNPAPTMRLEQPPSDLPNTVNSADILRQEFFQQNVASLSPERNIANPNLPMRMDMQATFTGPRPFNPFEYVPTQNYRPQEPHRPQFNNQWSMYPQQFRPQMQPQMAHHFNAQFNSQFRPPQFRPQQFNQAYADQQEPLDDYLPENPQNNFIPRNDANDRPPTQRTNNAERLVKLKLDNSTGVHRTADAMVYLPPGFNPDQKYDVVVFNHGFRSSAESSVREFDLINQMKKGHPQTVLIVPEWQVQAGASNHVQGKFAQQGFFTNMLKEIIQKTPELAQAGLNGIERMHLFSHSAGYTPTGSILNKNPEIAAKVQSVTMLDSLYSDTVMPWIQANQQAFANGEKQFRNIFGSETQANSRNQQERLRQMMARLGRPDAVRAIDGNNRFRDANASILFKRTNTSHGLIPNNYISNSMEHSDEV